MACWREERGFTLTELLVVLAVLALVLAAVVTIQQGALQAYVTGSNKTEVQQNARVALERIARQIRETTGPLTEATATSLTFTLPDPVTSLPTAVRYVLNGTSLNCTGLCDDQTVSAAPVVVIGGVQALTFAYYLQNSSVALGLPVTPASVFRVDITIQTGSEDTVVAGGIADTRAELTTSVRLRNL